jgi:hypothetical protein
MMAAACDGFPISLLNHSLDADGNPNRHASEGNPIRRK